MTIQLSYLNRGDVGTLSGGSWQPAMPLTNLQRYGLSNRARSVNLLAASTQFDIDLSTGTPIVRLFGIMGHSMSLTATYRLTGGDTPGATTYDSGWNAVWPAVYGAYDIPFETYDWWRGVVAQEEAALYRVKLITDLGINYTHRYWRVEFLDADNTAGVIDLHRLWFGPLWQPTINYSWGAAFGWSPRDRASVTISGARFVERRAAARVFRFSLGGMSDGEAFGRFLDMQKTVGSEGEIVVVPDPLALSQRHRRDIYGRVASWGDGAAQRFYNQQSASMTIEELL